MTQQPSNNTLTFVAIAVAIALLVWPLFGGGCGLPGWEISLPIGKVKVQPVITPAPQRPSTRCLIFGFSSCPACQQLHRTIRREVVPKGWKLGPLPTDDIEEIDIYSSDVRVSRYKHSSYPTLIIVDQAGKELDRKSDAMKSDALIAWIQSTRK